ncbi:MAG: alanine racemase [Acutalibacteraceae bacterium]|jgi:alanine racemase
MIEFLKRTWAQVDLDAITHNYRVIAGALRGGCKPIAIVKADAYGHGAVPVARALAGAGADFFGVSNLEEALQLRRGGIDAPILILSYTPPEEAARLSENGVIQTAVTPQYARELNEQAEKHGCTVRVHIKLDTGMARVGLSCRQEEEIAAAALQAAALCRLPHLRVEGIFTHFASADEQNDGGYTAAQFDRFIRVADALEKQGFSLVRHCCNSAATIRYPAMHLDRVRPGIILYGLAPDPGWMNGLWDLRPAMELKTAVSMVKTVPAGTPVSYGRTFTAKKDTVVATVPIGYADGYPRAMSGKAYMLVNGQKAPVIGRVCMDQCMLDVTGIPGVKAGSVVTVFGKDGDALLPVEDFAALDGTIHYETVCLIGKRVPRVYLRGGRVVDRLNYIAE